jgi:hypothetical protein
VPYSMGLQTLRPWDIGSNFPNFPNFPGIRNGGKFAAGGLRPYPDTFVA